MIDPQASNYTDPHVFKKYTHLAAWRSDRFYNGFLAS
ncbi:hypothetical protein Sinac_4279 [Singulisphaera acidiphila DSM 18658]|uniref:Uncharacterized protein n=1 Tax=Singulisphaera acidiphila (strain ATCC BAA-1392 / DSM 18658 / VKM B-2454 / MOB10) TaxID=886293 RepID=L0DI41_SINAD|nr:hypothetical protein Sinac_4279 [Singulisphaera acidiphila DSM 18658]